VAAVMAVSLSRGQETLGYRWSWLCLWLCSREVVWFGLAETDKARDELGTLLRQRERVRILKLSY
jgi:hypothetical protein